jgi:hypothetical protein
MLWLSDLILCLFGGVHDVNLRYRRIRFRLFLDPVYTAVIFRDLVELKTIPI